MAYYRPRFISQFGWGSRFDSENCNATAGAILLDRHTEGRKHATPVQVRALIDSPNKSGGLSLTDVEEALKRGWDEDIVNPLPFEPWGSFLQKVRQGRGAILFGDCSFKRNGRRNCPGPVGELPPNHAIYVNEDDEPRQRMLTYDPADHTAAAGIQWLSYSTLRRYGELWTNLPGMVNAGYSKITSKDNNNDVPPPAAQPDMAGCLGKLLGKGIGL